jgi:hypothetical protein
MILSVISADLLKQRYPVDICNDELWCYIWGMDWILTYRLDQWFSSAATEMFHAFIFKCQIFPLRMFKTRWNA